MPATKKITPQKRTHPLWWFAAAVCTVLTLAVILGGIVVFVGYLVIHPRVPVISVLDAHLDQFQYDIAGILVTQLNIIIRSRNDNTKAHASFSDFKLTLLFENMEIARLEAGPYDVRKNDSVDFNFVATSMPVPLNPEQMEDVGIYLNQDRVIFHLTGDVRTRWRVGLLGSVKFWCHLNCQLIFRRSDGSYIPSRCTSKTK
ncbi:hypothetical protein K2173_019010 [Erythroxylum novogranatense]|uniref:Late embryogenesis abundant protein LEA-2 subgroup domain-containing protein n=1 Tax=Erythroxylum novogranatense TaxID=1862640 RepID=A0AAV8SSD2_9ROSI|nr:hypothetical protein K2173_019010 [Erythroxylum novogranatense]